MKHFLKNILLATTIYLIGILLFVTFVHLIVERKFNFTLPDHNKYLIVGDSQPECAFNDSLINGFQNLSRSGEGYFYNYQKLKKIFSQNKIKAIFIEYSNDQIKKNMDKWIWGFDSMNNFFPLYSTWIDKKDVILLYKNNKKDFLKIISNSTRKNFFRILSFHYSYDQRYGKYRNLNKNKNENKIKAIERIKNKQHISHTNIDYLKKIVDLCNLNKVDIYFIRSPKHKYYSRENENILKRIKNEKFPNIDFLDFVNFPLDDSEFNDLTHLNYDGAKLFSKWFSYLINEGLLFKIEKQNFIDNEINKISK